MTILGRGQRTVPAWVSGGEAASAWAAPQPRGFLSLPMTCERMGSVGRVSPQDYLQPRGYLRTIREGSYKGCDRLPLRDPDG